MVINKGIIRLLLVCLLSSLLACSSKKAPSSADVAAPEGETAIKAAEFCADSAYMYVSKQVDFGPRVPNSAAHRAASKWLASELQRHGAKVSLQNATLKAFDGTPLEACNILGSYNPDAAERVILLAHWDCRPWADNDPDEANHGKPVPGANDGASGVGVLLEIARQLGKEAPKIGVDILFVDAEDWGTANIEDSWALGARHYVANMPREIATPQCGVLLDMVGGKNAVFCREYFSQYYQPDLVNALWNMADALGYGSSFDNNVGGAITDDHLEFIRVGIPVIDIIETSPDGGFNPRWHTMADDMDGIDAATLGKVGTTVLTWLRSLNVSE